jgi:hypothetical protein
MTAGHRKISSELALEFMPFDFSLFLVRRTEKNKNFV